MIAQWRASRFDTITTMQEMTTAICSAATTPNASATTYTTTYTTDKTKVPQNSLIDTRDNTVYIVRKLADGHCWMTSELEYSPTITFDGVNYYSRSHKDTLKPGNFIIPSYSDIDNLKVVYSYSQLTGFPLNLKKRGGYVQNQHTGVSTYQSAHYWVSDEYQANNFQTHCFNVTDSAVSSSAGCGCQVERDCWFEARYFI